jgi:hypothetical protein
MLSFKSKYNPTLYLLAFLRVFLFVLISIGIPAVSFCTESNSMLEKELSNMTRKLIDLKGLKAKNPREVQFSVYGIVGNKIGVVTPISMEIENEIVRELIKKGFTVFERSNLKILETEREKLVSGIKAGESVTADYVITGDYIINDQNYLRLKLKLLKVDNGQIVNTIKSSFSIASLGPIINEGNKDQRSNLLEILNRRSKTAIEINNEYNGKTYQVFFHENEVYLKLGGFTSIEYYFDYEEKVRAIRFNYSNKFIKKYNIIRKTNVYKKSGQVGTIVLLFNQEADKRKKTRFDYVCQLLAKDKSKDDCNKRYREYRVESIAFQNGDRIEKRVYYNREKTDVTNANTLERTIKYKNSMPKRIEGKLYGDNSLYLMDFDDSGRPTSYKYSAFGARYLVYLKSCRDFVPETVKLPFLDENECIYSKQEEYKNDKLVSTTTYDNRNRPREIVWTNERYKRSFAYHPQLNERIISEFMGSKLRSKEVQRSYNLVRKEWYGYFGKLIEKRCYINETKGFTYERLRNDGITGKIDDTIATRFIYDQKGKRKIAYDAKGQIKTIQYFVSNKSKGEIYFSEICGLGDNSFRPKKIVKIRGETYKIERFRKSGVLSEIQIYQNDKIIEKRIHDEKGIFSYATKKKTIAGSNGEVVRKEWIEVDSGQVIEQDVYNKDGSWGSRTKFNLDGKRIERTVKLEFGDFGVSFFYKTDIWSPDGKIVKIIADVMGKDTNSKKISGKEIFNKQGKKYREEWFDYKTGEHVAIISFRDDGTISIIEWFRNMKPWWRKWMSTKGKLKKFESYSLENGECDLRTVYDDEGNIIKSTSWPDS